MKDTLIIVFLVVCQPLLSLAQELWPRVLQAKDGSKITIYQPQPEKLNGKILSGRTAVSVLQKTAKDPVFGALWFTAEMETNRDNRMAILQKLRIDNVKVPGMEDSSKLKDLKKLLETEAPKWKLGTTIDEIAASLDEEQRQAMANYKNDPPAILYTTQYTVLVLTDGEPKLEMDENLKMKRVINSAFLIVQSPKNNLYYLNGGSSWYESKMVLEGWKNIKTLPADIQSIDKAIKQNSQTATTTTPSEVPAITVSTRPAELIQTKGAANLSPISGTNLLYVSNTDEDIFMDITTNKYFVLISGRWYTASSLTDGKWLFVDPDKLPADFAKIPKGSEKDAVLASVPGTEEAHDAVMDAQIPQTAKVDKATATCTVKYNGEPKFEKIEGTSLYLAKNTSATVILSGKDYYCVENGVWFKATGPTGPWKVSDERPKDVDNIPPASEAYNVKYVYIYETTPQYVYVGYTPGYLGCYVYGPVVIYGTGYYYNPWYGPYYYPRPVTYGFSVHYNPFTGWGIGFHYSTGFFSFHYYAGVHPGYWGPPRYHPPYHPHYHGGMYGGRGPVYIGGDVNINIDKSRNIYNNQRGVATSDIKRNTGKNNPASMPANGLQKSSDKNDVLLDRQGNVYKPGQTGEWQQLAGEKRTPASNTEIMDLDRQMQSRERSMNRNTSFNGTKQTPKRMNTTNKR
jgi:hypothetical protein